MQFRLLILLSTLFLTNLSHAQEKNCAYYVSLIDSALIKKNLYVLASDEYEGRGNGTKGGEMAMNYIVDDLTKNKVETGNKGSYFQNIEASAPEKGNLRFILDKFNYHKDYEYSNSPEQDSIIQTDEIVFVGYGVYSNTYNDFGTEDIKGKVILRIGEGNIPTSKLGIKYAERNESEEFLAANPPKAILDARLGFSEYYSYYPSNVVYKTTSNRSSSIPQVRINERLANKILEPSGKTVKQIAFETEQSGTPALFNINKSISFSGKSVYKNANLCNIVGLVEGSTLKDEYIVVSAHYDHQAKYYNTIYNGADDNASGVAALMELGRILTKAKKEGNGLKRSVILLFTVAEEDGLKGSEYYVNQPIFPLDKTKYCVNVDMVGRMSTARLDAQKDNHYVYVVNHKEKSQPLVEKVEQVNQQSINLELDYTHTTPGDSEQLFSRSDQYNFSEKGVPAIMFTSGTHGDYHRPSDDADLIDYDGLWKRTQLLFHLVWELANEKE